MIRARNALSRQVQNFFHSHLLGLYRWDDVEHAKPQGIDRPEKAKDRAEQSWFRGQTHDRVEMWFGPFNLTVLGPFEDEQYPCGRIVIRSATESMEGPLDPGTWDRVAAFVKEHNHEEIDNGSTARDDWGR